MSISAEESEKIRTIVEGAFSPLTCVAEIWDYGSQLRFRVSDANCDDIHTSEGIWLENINNENDLQQLIRQVRKFIQEKGFILK